LALERVHGSFTRREPPEEASNAHLHHHRAPLSRRSGAGARVIAAFCSARSASVQAVAQVVLEYLQAHPQGADTVEGISAWWLGTSRRGPRVAAVVEALEALATRGVVTCETIPAGDTVYRLRRPAN
jgi:hypothetical protein